MDPAEPWEYQMHQKDFSYDYGLMKTVRGFLIY